MAWITSLNWMSNPFKKCYTINVLNRFIPSTNSDVTNWLSSLSLLLLSSSIAVNGCVNYSQARKIQTGSVFEDWWKRKREEMGEGVGKRGSAGLRFLLSPSSPSRLAIRIHFITFQAETYRVSLAVTKFLKFLNPSSFEVVIVLTPLQSKKKLAIQLKITRINQVYMLSLGLTVPQHRK